MQKKIDEIILSLSLMFTVFFFSSAEIYIDNKNEFVVEGKDIIIPLLITALAAAAINFAVLFIAGKIHPVLNAFIKCTELGAVLALYSQYMFFNGEMLNIGDDSFAYMQNDALINKNFTVFTVIFLLPAVITLAAVPLKKVKAKTVLKNMTLYISALVFVMQLAGLFGETVQNINKKSTADSEYYIAYEPAMSLSANGNVIVFIVDMLDGEWMETALVDYPELMECFDGFTFYRNNVSEYPYTFPSITQMVTREEYDFGDWEDYFARAWKNRNILDDLKEAGYDADLLIDKPNAYELSENIRDKCENVKPLENAVKINYFGELGIIKVMTDISLGTHLPYVLKPIFLEKYDSGFSATFIVYNDLPEDYMVRVVGSGNDINFYNYLKKHGLNADSQNKKFVLTHLNGMHDVSREVSMLSPDFDKDGKCNKITTARGCFEILGEYFEQLKNLGIYDNSTIIVLGDHGRPTYDISQKKAYKLDDAITTALLIKPANAERGTLKLNDTAQLSHKNFAASVLDYAGIESDKYGPSYREIEENNIPQTRYFQTYVVEKNVFTKGARYSVNGYARDFNNWKLEE